LVGKIAKRRETPGGVKPIREVKNLGKGGVPEGGLY